jgi:SAM-dependent methyltransferase
VQLIYRHAPLYAAVNWLLYGRHHHTRYRVIADLIPQGASVLELCCGPATLYHRFLRARNVRYTGLDISPNFIGNLNKRGGLGIVRDLRSDQALPPADFVIIQGALYFFLPDPSGLIGRMLAAAGRGIIIAESIRNLSTSSIPLLPKLANRLAGAVDGEEATRFTEETLDQLFDDYPPQLKRSFKIPGGRDKVYVLEKIGASSPVG